MKKFFIIILSLLFLLTACGKTEENPQPVEPETNLIQTVPATEPEATEAPGPEAEGETLTPTKTGTVYRLVRTTVLDESGNENWHQEYFYDDYGREKQTQQFTDGVITYSAITTYTSDTEYETAIEAGESRYSIRFTCDDAGRVIYEEMVQDGSVTEKRSYAYDQYGNQLSLQLSYDGEDETVFSYEYTYDEAGNPLSRKEYQDGELVGWLEMEYDGSGREIASAYYYPDDVPSYSTVSTWEGSTETRTSYDSEGYAYTTLVINYDETGNILSQEVWQEGVMLSCTEYTYEAIEIIAE